MPNRSCLRSVLPLRLLLVCALGGTIGIGAVALAKPTHPVLFVPPEHEIPQSEPPPAGQKLALFTPPPEPLAAKAAVPAPPKAPAKARRLHITIAPLPSEGVSETAMVGVQRELGEALKRNNHLEMKDLDIRLAEFAQEMPADQVDFARDSLQKGRDAMFKMDLDKAIGQLSDAVDQLVAVLPYIKKQELADAMMSLAVAQFQKGNPKGMQQTLRRLLTWRPTYQADTSQTPPQMNDSIEAARQAVSQLPQGQISVTSEPTGAQVFVDGDYVGVAPTVAANLPIGEHYVTFKRLGSKRGLRAAQVTAAGVQVVGKLQPSEKHLLVDQAITKVASQMGQSPLDSVIDNLRETLFLDQMIFVQAQKVGNDELQLRAYLYDLHTRHLLGTRDFRAKAPNGTPPSGSLAGLADGLFEGVDYDGGLRAPVDAPPPAANENKPLYKRWWFWTAVGVIAVGTVTALAVGLSNRPVSCPSGHACTGTISYALTF